jgi:hypothetical protein
VISGGGMSFSGSQFAALAFLLLCLAAGVSCSTPEGGSSIPWNRPQSWEHQMPMGVNPGYAR